MINIARIKKKSYLIIYYYRFKSESNWFNPRLLILKTPEFNLLKIILSLYYENNKCSPLGCQVETNNGFLHHSLYIGSFVSENKSHTNKLLWKSVLEKIPEPFLFHSKDTIGLLWLLNFFISFLVLVFHKQID